MGILSRKHRKNRGARYDRRKAAQLARHMANQIGRSAKWHQRMFWRIANLVAIPTKPS
jgi:hypothetical protein